jgi:hypothetical protein
MILMPLRAMTLLCPVKAIFGESAGDRGGSVGAGVLVHGGTAPVRVVEHFTELTATGVLIRL